MEIGDLVGDNRFGNKHMGVVTSLDPEKNIYRYHGFDGFGRWINGGWRVIDECHYTPSHKEWEQALQKEAIKRGFVEGARFRHAETATDECVGSGKLELHNRRLDTAYIGLSRPFYNGKWADVIHKPSTNDANQPQLHGFKLGDRVMTKGWRIGEIVGWTRDEIFLVKVPGIKGHNGTDPNLLVGSRESLNNDGIWEIGKNLERLPTKITGAGLDIDQSDESPLPALAGVYKQAENVAFPLDWKTTSLPSSASFKTVIEHLKPKQAGSNAFAGDGTTNTIRFDEFPFRAVADLFIAYHKPRWAGNGALSTAHLDEPPSLIVPTNGAISKNQKSYETNEFLGKGVYETLKELDRAEAMADELALEKLPSDHGAPPTVAGTTNVDISKIIEEINRKHDETSEFIASSFDVALNDVALDVTLDDISRWRVPVSALPDLIERPTMNPFAWRLRSGLEVNLSRPGTPNDPTLLSSHSEGGELILVSVPDPIM